MHMEVDCMIPGIYRLKEPAFIFETGDTLHLMPDSYEMNICDVCGQRRKCDWLENCHLEDGRTGMDCCRTCQRKILEVVEDESQC